MSPRIAWVAFAAVTVWVILCSQQNHMSVNPASRYALMEALIEHKTFALDDTVLGGRTVDKVEWNGQKFSSKPPLLPALLAPTYALVRGVTGEGFREATYPTVRWMRLFVAVIPWVGAMAVWWLLLLKMDLRDEERGLLLFAMVAGGLPTAYATHLDNHSFAFLALLAIALVGFDAVVDHARATPAKASLLGLLGGLAICFDLGATPLVGLGFLWAAWTWRKRPAIVINLVVGLALAPACQTAMQWAMTGQLKPFYLLPEAYDYAGSYWRRPVEFDALSEAKPLYAFHALLGHHGVFSLTPWLLLALPWFAKREAANELLRWTVIGGTVFVVGYYVMRTVNYGGRCVGMRWLMVLHPILAVAAARIVHRYDLVRRAPVLLGVLIALSAVSALTGAVNPWEEGWVYGLFRGLGLGSVPG